MIVSVFVASLVTLVTADFYSSRYDHFDVQPLIENDRILLSYTKCFLDQGPCTPDAKDFKSKHIGVMIACILNIVSYINDLIYLKAI